MSEIRQKPNWRYKPYALARTIALATTIVLVLLGSAVPAAAAAELGSAKELRQSPVSWSAGPAVYGAVIDPNVKIVMPDGIALVGDVMYPADPGTGQRAIGKFPVLLAQNPYRCQSTARNDGFGSAAGDPTFFARHGYIFASICVRGAGRSGGTFAFFGQQEQDDGVRLVHWAAHRLSGSNGVVGLDGCSYLGNDQLFTAGALGPHSPVKALLPSCAGSEQYREVFFSGGMPTQTFNYLRSLTFLIGDQAGAFGNAVAANIAAGGDDAYYRSFWQQREPGNWAAQIVNTGIPVLLWTGWHDIYIENALSMYAYLQNAYFHRPVYSALGPGRPTTPKYQIVVGAGGHGQGISQAMEIEWFDTWLKKKRTPFTTTPTPMHIYEQGSNTWVNTSSYPMVERYTPYYLGAGNTLTITPPRRTGGSYAISYTQPGSANGSLTYTTAPFKKGATLAGPISATIYASSTSTNLNIIATLSVVAPDGAVTALTSGSLVGSLRALEPGRSWADGRGIDIRPYGSFSRDSYLQPGKIYELNIALAPRVTQVEPRDSLRLTITTQAATSTCKAALGSDPCFPTSPQRATLPGVYHIFSSAGAPSAINIPLEPYACFPPTGGHGDQPVSLIGMSPHADPCSTAAVASTDGVKRSSSR